MNEKVIPLEILQAERVRAPAGDNGLSISIVENDRFYEIRSALPGVDADDVFVGIADDVLTIGCKTCTEKQTTIGRFFSIDHRVATVEQSFALPPDADTHQLTTTFRNGVLSVLLARTPGSNVVPFAR